MGKHRLTIIHGADIQARSAALNALLDKDAKQEYHVQSCVMRMSVVADFDTLPDEWEFQACDTLVVNSANWLLEDPKGWWKPVVDSIIDLFARHKGPLHTVLVSNEPMIDEWYHHLSVDGLTVSIINTGIRATA